MDWFFVLCGGKDLSPSREDESMSRRVKRVATAETADKHLREPYGGKCNARINTP